MDNKVQITFTTDDYLDMRLLTTFYKLLLLEPDADEDDCPTPDAMETFIESLGLCLYAMPEVRRTEEINGVIEATIPDTVAFFNDQT